MKVYAICLLCLLLLAACDSRSAAIPETSAASVMESSSAPSAPEAPPSAAPEESSSIPEEPEEEAFPAPILTDTEKELLASNLSLFAHFIGKQELTAAQVSKDVILNASLAEIERTKDLNAYFFAQDDQGNDLIPVTQVAEKAMQLFGAETFVYPEAEAYNSEKDCYVGKPVDIPPAKASDIMGAADDNVAYSVAFDESEYIYTAKIFRQNGMPYLRFVSSEQAAPTGE